MSERAWLLAEEALGHWLLAWTLVVLAVVLWIRVRRPRRPPVSPPIPFLAASLLGGASLADRVGRIVPVT